MFARKKTSGRGRRSARQFRKNLRRMFASSGDEKNRNPVPEVIRLLNSGISRDDYFATRSSHLTIDSMTIIEQAVAPTNTSQHTQIGTEV